jgi:hypothetical protein
MMECFLIGWKSFLIGWNFLVPYIGSKNPDVTPDRYYRGTICMENEESGPDPI